VGDVGEESGVGGEGGKVKTKKNKKTKTKTKNNYFKF
jgi:hypothetical protein